MRYRPELLVSVILIVVFFTWFFWPVLWSASDDARLVSVFNTDEAKYVSMLKESIEQHRLTFVRQDQGHFYINLVLFPLFVLSGIVPISEQMIIFSFRLISLVFGIATVVTVFLLVRRYFGRLAAWWAAVMLSMVPVTFLQLTGMIHTDVTQLFFLVSSVYLCCRFTEERSLKYLLFSSACAGIAFSTKYVGILLLAFLWIVVILHAVLGKVEQECPSRLDRQFRQLSWLIVGAGGALLVLMGILLSSDWVADFSAVFYGEVDKYYWTQILEGARLPSVFVGLGLVVLAGLKAFFPVNSRRCLVGPDGHSLAA